MVVRTYTRLEVAMSALGCSSLELSEHCSISNSLISRWRNGSRKLTAHSDAALELASALVKLDKRGELDPLLEPYRLDGTGHEEAMWLYLVDSAIPSLPSEGSDTVGGQGDEFLSQQYVLLGRRGFQKGALLMLDYVDRLPDSQEVIVCALHSTELWHNDLSFALRFLRKLRRAVARGVRFTVVETHADSMQGSPHFSAFWLAQNLKGVFRGRVFHGDAPEYFVGTIPGYWSGRVEPDPDAKDGLVSTFSTDPRNVNRDTNLCRKYLSQCAPPSQYGFLRAPEGNSEYPQRWSASLDASFAACAYSSISRLPLFGVMTADEFSQVSGINSGVSIPRFLFSSEAKIPTNARRLILCSEAVHEALTTSATLSPPLSSLLCKETWIPRRMIRDLVRRVLIGLSDSADFQVALVPKRAFSRMQIEFITWRGCGAVGWLQDHSESLFDTEPTVVVSFDQACDYLWEKLSASWKDQAKVRSTLAGWLNAEHPRQSELEGAAAGDWSPGHLM